MATPDDEKIGPKQELEVRDIYASVVDLAIHSQDNRMNLFSSFLFFQSILLLAWATIWQTGGDAARGPILLVLSGFGTLSSILWAALGSDYANSGRQFSQAAAELEKYFPKGVRHFITERENAIANNRLWKSGRLDRVLIALVTWGFVFLYPFLEIVIRLWKSG